MNGEASNKLNSTTEDITHIKRLKEGDIRSFDFLFGKYYKDLVLFCKVFLKDQSHSEDIVQDIFVRLWENRENLKIDSSLKGYLMTSAKNNCFEELKHQEVVRNHQDYILYRNDVLDYDTEHYLLYTELNERLQEAMQKLPEDMRIIFEMNRFKNLKYREIAEKLNISVRTVENKISKTLELLRKQLNVFYDLMLLFIINMMR